MLDATRGFNHGADGARVEAGDRLADDFAAPAVIDLLLSKGVLVPVIDDTRPAKPSKSRLPSPHTPNPNQAATEPLGEQEPS